MLFFSWRCLKEEIMMMMSVVGAIASLHYTGENPTKPLRNETVFRFSSFLPHKFIFRSCRQWTLDDGEEEKRSR